MPELHNAQLLRTQPFINGEWVNTTDAKTFPVYNPATQALLADCQNCSAADTRTAIDSAHRALAGWKHTPAKQRAQLLRRWFELINENAQDLATLMTLEQGKPLKESLAEIHYAASYVEWFAEEAKRLYGDQIPAPKANQRIFTSKQPVGVVAAITPWNFPSAMITRKAGPALAAGCTLVIKPASETPLSALAMVELANQAGFPPGAINIVMGSSGPIGAELTANPKVRKLSFTGSTAIGKMLIEQCAATVKRTSMELGGNAPFIVFEDADIDAAVQGAIIAKFRNAGQTCVCANRLLVHEDIYDEFAQRLLQAMSTLKIGDGLEENADLGPLVSQRATSDVKALLDDAIDKGASALLHPEPVDGPCFFTPTILTGIDDSMRINSEEIFGPIAPLFAFGSEDEAIEIANSTEYGLAAYAYTNDYRRMQRLTDNLDFGMIGINECLISNEAMPFGGVKESGTGREGSKYGIDEYIDIKTTTIGGF